MHDSHQQYTWSVIITQVVTNIRHWTVGRSKKTCCLWEMSILSLIHISGVAKRSLKIFRWREVSNGNFCECLLRFSVYFTQFFHSNFRVFGIVMKKTLNMAYSQPEYGNNSPEAPKSMSKYASKYAPLKRMFSAYFWHLFIHFSMIPTKFEPPKFSKNGHDPPKYDLMKKKLDHVIWFGKQEQYFLDKKCMGITRMFSK